MNKKNLIRAGIVLAFVAAIIITAQITKNSAGTDEIAQPIRPVKTFRVESIPAQFQRGFPGRVTASQTVDLSFLGSGEVTEFPVREGQSLKQGEIIAKLDDSDARSNLDAAGADLNLARVELERNRTLFEEELISAAEYDIKKRSYNVALAAYQISNKAVLDRLILAPFDGLVAKRFVENYEKVEAGQKVVTFIDPTSIDITIDLPESVFLQWPNFRSSYSAEFEQAPMTPFPLTLKEFATVADPYTKTYAVTLQMDRPEESDILILPDMTVKVRMDASRRSEVDVNNFLVPSTAVVYDVNTDGSVIWIVDESTDPITVLPRIVMANRSEAGEIVITEGLKDKDLIVVAGGGFLNSGQQVRIFEQ